MRAENDSLFKIRPARPEEADALSVLALRSKAHWGYDADFMDRCREPLRVTPAMIAAGQVMVAEAQGVARGVMALAADDGVLEIKLLFIAPEAIGTGVGRALWAEAQRRAHAGGHSAMLVVSDPFAEGFYLKMGATRVGVRASEVDAERKLPLMRFEL
jgi:GNAT superfamily N-acetyltransferase